MSRISNNTITINSKGQMVLPVDVRRSLGVTTNTKLRIKATDQVKMTILLEVESNPVRKWRGVIQHLTDKSVKELITESKKADNNRDRKLAR